MTLIDSELAVCDVTKIVTDKTYLNKKCFDVTPEQATKILFKLDEAFKYNPTAIGIAANQIGISANVSLIIINKERTELINPVVISGEDAFISRGEGCLSIPKRFFDVKRFNHFVIKNNVLESDMFRAQTEYYYVDNRENAKPNLTCFAVQHEIDHLNGVLISDAGIKLHPEVKIGRNDLCSCGSGKKYKKCCGTI